MFCGSTRSDLFKLLTIFIRMNPAASIVRLFLAARTSSSLCLSHPTSSLFVIFAYCFLLTSQVCPRHNDEVKTRIRVVTVRNVFIFESSTESAQKRELIGKLKNVRHAISMGHSGAKFLGVFCTFKDFSLWSGWLKRSSDF